MARNTRVERVHNDDQSMTFRNVDGEGEFTAKLADYPQEIQDRIVREGLNKVLGDFIADPERWPDPVAGIKIKHEALVAGQWRLGSDGEGGASRTTDLHEALFRMAKAGQLDKAVGKTDDETKANIATALEQKSKEEKTAMKKNPTVALHIDAVQEEKRKAKRKALQDAAKSGEVEAVAL